jgi:hypothetical protein
MDWFYTNMDWFYTFPATFNLQLLTCNPSSHQPKISGNQRISAVVGLRALLFMVVILASEISQRDFVTQPNWCRSSACKGDWALPWVGC